MEEYSWWILAIVYLVTALPMAWFGYMFWQGLREYFVQQSSGYGAVFQTKLTVYTLLFTIFDICVLLGGFAVMMAPFGYGAFEAFNPEIVDAVVDGLAVRREYLGYGVMFLWPVSFLVGVSLMSSACNPFDYGREQKRTWLATVWHATLDEVLDITPKLDLRRYTQTVNVPVNADRRRWFESKLQAYEEYRYTQYRRLFRRPLQKRIAVEIIALVSLLLAGVIGIRDTVESDGELSTYASLLALVSLFGLVCWVMVVAKRRYLVRQVRIQNTAQDGVGKKYLEIVSPAYKTTLLEPLLRDEFVYEHEYSPGYERRSQTILASALWQLETISPERIKVTDTLTTKNTASHTYMAEVEIAESTSEREFGGGLRGLYIETTFGEEFAGDMYVVSKNKLASTNEFLSTPERIGAQFVSESTDFNEQFSVYTDSQLEARLALKTNIMSNLLTLAQINRQVYVLLSGHTAYIYVDTYANFFEYPYLHSRLIDWRETQTNLGHAYDAFEQQVLYPLAVARLLDPRSNRTR